ncbi:MAG: response regulator transcription factor [Burkholderiales bacterium]
MNARSEPDARDVVLVVDDTPDTLGLVIDALEGAGMTVLVATDGPTALARVDRVTPDVILLDALMPGMDGFETCRALRAMPSLAPVPILFMTGLTEPEHVVRGFDAGGVDYVTKPLDPDVLIARIRTHLANARRMSSTRAALDAAGRALVAIGPAGEVLWHTPKAQRFIAAMAAAADGASAFPDALLRWLPDAGVPPRPLAWPEHEPRFLITSLGGVGNGQRLIAVEETDESGARVRLAARFGLTEREAEVLYWVVRGKSNRDVGDILGSSPRTVDKHMERILTKLGVENRSAAVAAAIRAASD